MPYSVIFCLAMLLMVSCRSRKETVMPTDDLLTEALLEKVQDAELPWQWFSAKLDIKAENVPNLSGQIRMQRDSVIWISVTALLGMEAARVMVTPDSVSVINKLENAYSKTSFEALCARFGMDLRFAELQDALLGNCLWMLDTGPKTRAEKDGQYEIGSEGGSSLLCVRSHDFKTTQALLSSSWLQLQLSYGRFQPLGSHVIPTKIGCVMKGMYDFAGQFEYTSVTLNQDTAFPFKISPKMKRVRL